MAALCIQTSVADLNPSPSTAVEVLVEKEHVSTQRIWELAAAGKRAGFFEIVRFFQGNPSACISVTSHAFFDANRGKNPQKAKVASARVIIRVYDTDLDKVLETSDAVNGEAGVQLRPLSDESEYDPRFRLLWLPGKARDEVIVVARNLAQDVATPKGI